jgi:hypothetical protein
MSRNKIDVSGVLQNFAATFTKLIGHGGKNTVVSYVAPNCTGSAGTIWLDLTRAITAARRRGD